MLKIRSRQTLAAILVNQRQDLDIDTICLPNYLDVGQVLVRLSFSGICGTQLGEIDGAKGPDKWLPHLLGHEGIGEVLEVGPGVSKVSSGDRVIAHWRPGNGIKSKTPTYTRGAQKINAGFVTTFNKEAVISENRLTIAPPSIPTSIGALYGCAVPTGFGVVDNVARVRLGDTVIVFGAGGVGLNIIQASVLSGAKDVIAIDRFDSRLAKARVVGATTTINSSDCDVAGNIAACLGGNNKTDVFFDNSGAVEFIELGYELLKPTGKLVLVGVPKVGQKSTFFTLDLHFGKSIIGTTGGDGNIAEDIVRYAQLLQSRNIDLNSIVSEIAPLSKVNDLIAAMRNGEISGRCLLDLGD